MVIMIVFTMMAVGLNIVVGYAGLLDLGYVAFYAAGAVHGRLVRVAAVRPVDVPLRLGRDQPKDVPGIHLSIWLVLLMAGLFTMSSGS